MPLRFVDPQAHDQLERGDRLRLSGLREQIRAGNRVRVECPEKGLAFDVGHDLSTRQIEVLLAGGLINWVRQRLARAAE
jgi:aconitate hydratase